MDTTHIGLMQAARVHQGCSALHAHQDAFTQLVPLLCLPAAAFRCLYPAHLMPPSKKVYGNVSACLGGGQEWDGERSLHPTMCLH